MMFGNDNAVSTTVMPEKPRALSGIHASIQRHVLGALAASLLLVPSAALADNECDPVLVPSANGSLADSYECDEASYGDGVTYSTDGDLTLNFTNADDLSTIGGGGVSLTGTGSDGITVDSATGGTELENQSGMTGALLGVTTVNGDIDIDVEEMDADRFSASGVTHAISAESTGTGSIDIVTTGLVDANGSNPSTSIGIEAVTAGGDIAITADDTVRGEAYGIRAVAGGSGDLTITAAGGVSGAGTAAIDATTGTGLLTISLAPATVSFPSINGDIRINAGGDAVINIAAGRSNGFQDLDLTVAGETTLNNDGTISGTTLDFSNLAGGYTFNNNAGAVWDAGNGLNNLGAGILNNAGRIELTGAAFVDRIGDEERITVISAPNSTYTGMGGILETIAFLNSTTQADCANVTVAGCLDLQGGATSGQTSILINGRFTTLVTGALATVTSINTGIVLVDVGGGSSEAGHFVLHPDSTFVQADGVGTGLITTAAYATDPIYGAVLDTSVLGMGGIFDYALLYNPDTQQHVLASVPQSEAIEYMSFIRQMSSVWHTTTDVIVGRQAALRDGATGRLWARYVNDGTDYDAAPSFSTQGNTFVYDQQYSLDTQSLIIGLDLIAEDDRVFGIHGGLIESDSKFEGTGTSDEHKGVTAGFYGAWWHDSGLSLDGAINLTSLTIDHSLSSNALESGDSDARSLGIRLEGGWRVPLMEETLYVQPLATAAYVLADFDDVDLRDNEVSFEGTESSRAGLGARVGGAVELANARFSKVSYWLTGRAWEEYADDSEARFATDSGGYMAIADDRSGSFEEVELGVNFTNREGNLDVHLAGGIQSGDEIDSSNRFSIGARLNW